MGEPGTKEILTLEELEAAGGDPHRPQAHPLDPGREQAGRADPHRRPVRAARLQHRHAGGRSDRRPSDLAHHAHARRRDAPDRPGDQAAAQAGQRASRSATSSPRRRSPASWRCSRSSADGASRAARSCRSCEIFRGKIIDVTKRSVTIEVTGTADKIEAFERMVRPVRPDRDGAHRRDRDLARARRDLAAAQRPDGPARADGARARPAGAPARARPCAAPGRSGARSLAAAHARGRPAASTPARSPAPRGAPGSAGSASSSPTATAARWPRWACVRELRPPGRGRFGRAWPPPGGRCVRRRRGRRATPGRRARGPVSVGGFAFAPDGGAAPQWAGFAPAVAGRARAGARPPRRRRCAPTLAALAAPDDTAEELLARLERRLSELARRRCRCSTRLRPTACGWRAPCPPEHYEAAVARAVERIRAGELEKVVLAREVAGARARAATTPRAVLRRPAGRRSRAATASASARGEAAFVGASPELLVRREGQRARRSRSPAPPAAAPTRRWTTSSASSCCTRAKDREEQAIVARRIERTLRPQRLGGGRRRAGARARSRTSSTWPRRSAPSSPSRWARSSSRACCTRRPAVGGEPCGARRAADPGARGPRPRLVRGGGRLDGRRPRTASSASRCAARCCAAAWRTATRASASCATPTRPPSWPRPRSSSQALLPVLAA